MKTARYTCAGPLAGQAGRLPPARILPHRGERAPRRRLVLLSNWDGGGRRSGSGQEDVAGTGRKRGMPVQLSFFRFKAVPVARADLSASCDHAPVDCEPCDYPVVRSDLVAGCDGVAGKPPSPPREYGMAMVRGHGSFVAYRMPERAFRCTSSLKASCKAPLPFRLPPLLECQGGGEKW